MIIHSKKRFNNYWKSWVRKRNRQGNPQTFNSHNLYILPSGFGWIYILVVLMLLVGAINYQINTIFLMTFLLVIIGLVSAFEAQANLKNLSVNFITVEDAQQGTPAKIILFIKTNNKMRFGIEFQIASQPKIRVEEISVEGIQFVLPIETTMRGYFALPPIIISSIFPFGIFRSWGYAYFEAHYYVYPQAINPDFWPAPFIDQNENKKHTLGDEEFYDLKQVENPWVEPKRIHWRIAAKGQGWYLKTMESNEMDYWLFRLNDLPDKDLESKLQHLSYWVQTAELEGLIYGLELPTIRTRFARGKEHLQHCLRQLALYK